MHVIRVMSLGFLEKKFQHESNPLCNSPAERIGQVVGSRKPEYNSIAGQHVCNVYA